MADLFSVIDDQRHQENVGDWRPPEPPSLEGISEIELDCETNGLRWWEGNRPIGIGICLPNERTFYLPWAHNGGGNLDEAAVKRWAQRELRGKHIVNANTKFDVHMLRAWGIDLAEQGCTVSDVQHYAALLDDQRRVFNQAVLCADFLSDDEQKVIEVQGVPLDSRRMASYHAGTVAVRAEADVRQVHKLKKVMLPQLEAKDLMRVKALEDEIIYVSAEMEWNGAPLDVEMLDQWIKETEQEYLKIIFEIYRETSLRVNPDSPDDLKKIFSYYKIPITDYTDAGAASFTDAVMKKIDHPIIKKVRRAGKLADLRSKYLLKYRKCIDSHGVLRYALHQLRTDDNGTNRGRFSSSEIVDGVGANVQQVLAVEKQMTDYGDDYIVRRLFKPLPGYDFVSADEMQVEYRYFAHLINVERINKVYEKDPEASFHKMVWADVKKIRPDVGYKPMKNLNFARLYSAGIVKLAVMLGDITEAHAKKLNAKYKNRPPRDLPELQNAIKLDAIYNRVLPEAKQLNRLAMDIAKEGHDEGCKPGCRKEHRGFVKTILGRRATFPGGFRIHAALNAVIQGSCADITKLKLVEVWKRRKELGLLMRHTEHDEVCGDLKQEPGAAARLKELLNRQVIKLRIPIFWDVNTGPDWADHDVKKVLKEREEKAA